MTSATPRHRTVPASEDGGTPASDRRRLPSHRWWHHSYVGLAGAVTFLCLSVTPSLLPRNTVLQGVISGVNAAFGYGIGVLVVWLARSLSTRPLPRPGPVAWRWLAALAAVATAVFGYLGSGWQGEVHRLMGLPAPSRLGFSGALVVAVLVAAALVGLVRLLRAGARRFAAFLGRWIPAQAARTIAGLVVVVLALGVLNEVVIEGFFAVTDRMFGEVNGETEPGVQPPDDPLRSGGPGSLVSWASLGNQGRTFVAGGPTPSSCATSAARSSGHRSGSTSGWTPRRRHGSGPPSRRGSWNAPARSPGRSCA